MRVIPPVPINDVNLISSSASSVHAPAAHAGGTTYAIGALVSVAADYRIYESLQDGNLGKTPSTEPLWWRAIGGTETLYSSGTTYALGATVSGLNHRVYESLQAANLNKPLPVLPATATDWWFDIGPTNKWAMFDSSSNTQTVWPSPLTVVFMPGMRVNTIGITGMAANSITITATSLKTSEAPGVVTTVWGPRTTNLNIREVGDAYDYAFKLFSTQPSLAHFDIPPYSDIVFTVTLSATSGNVKCGSIIVGTYVYLGDAQYGARGDALNFSTVERDIYGNATLVPRRSVPKINVSLMAPKFRVNSIRAARSALNAVPALWSGLDDGSSEWFDMLLVMGVYKAFEITADNFSNANITLEIEEI